MTAAAAAHPRGKGGGEHTVGSRAGFARAVDVDRSRAAGFDLHLSKPVDVRALLEAVDAVTNTRERA